MKRRISLPRSDSSSMFYGIIGIIIADLIIIGSIIYNLIQSNYHLSIVLSIFFIFGISITYFFWKFLKNQCYAEIDDNYIHIENFKDEDIIDLLNIKSVRLHSIFPEIITIDFIKKTKFNSERIYIPVTYRNRQNKLSTENWWFKNVDVLKYINDKIENKIKQL